MQNKSLARVQFITHQNDRYSYYSSAIEALECGLKFIQLRMKDASDKDVISIAKRLRVECDKHNAILTIDDRIHLLQTNLFDGVHIGKQDTPTLKAKQITKDKYLLGCTANTIEDIVNAYNDGADYIGLGPFRFTTTKKNLSTILGFEGYEKILKAINKKNISIPIYAIGGIEVKDLQQMKDIGVFGVALSSVILNSNNAKQTIKEIINIYK